MTARDYYRHVQQIIGEAIFVLDSQVSYNEIDINECYIRGILTLSNGHQLHTAEYVITEPSIIRPKYRYHLQNSDAVLVARWDNSPHHSEIDTFPYHYHFGDGSIHASPAMDIASVLATVITFFD